MVFPEPFPTLFREGLRPRTGVRRSRLKIARVELTARRTTWHAANGVPPYLGTDAANFSLSKRPQRKCPCASSHRARLLAGGGKQPSLRGNEGEPGRATSTAGPAPSMH